MVYKQGFSYYLKENMINGILIDVHEDILEIDRRIYSASDLAGSVGGFSSAIKIVIIMLLPLLTNSELESYLISSLYKQAPDSRIAKPSEQLTPEKKLLIMS